MRISPAVMPPTRYQAVAPQAQAAQTQAPRAVRAADGPPPEYSLWSMLKDLGSRVVNAIKGLFGRD